MMAKNGEGLAEVTNRTILQGLTRKVEELQTEWADLLDEILWAYRSTPREATQESPYSLVFGLVAVTPLERVESSLRISEYENDDNELKRRECLDLVDERRIKAQKRSTEYHRRIKKAFDRKVNPQFFAEDDLVLRSIQATGNISESSTRSGRDPSVSSHATTELTNSRP